MGVLEGSLKHKEELLCQLPGDSTRLDSIIVDLSALIQELIDIIERADKVDLSKEKKTYTLDTKLVSLDKLELEDIQSKKEYAFYLILIVTEFMFNTEDETVLPTYLQMGVDLGIKEVFEGLSKSQRLKGARTMFDSDSSSTIEVVSSLSEAGL